MSLSAEKYAPAFNRRRLRPQASRRKHEICVRAAGREPKLASLTRSRAHNRVPQAIVSSFTSESLQEIQPGIVAIRPEQTCNELAKSRDLDILCPYPMPHGHEDDHAFKGICAEQTLLLISGESYRRRMAACRP
jgi:hypothetical protein